MQSTTTTTDQHALATPAEAAEFLRVSRSTLYELMAAGDIESIKLRRCRRIRWADLYAIARGDS